MLPATCSAELNVDLCIVGNKKRKTNWKKERTLKSRIDDPKGVFYM